jgi:WD40 repeat protein/serine/threonine protein kinase/Tfp pilus assembly protein PilF
VSVSLETPGELNNPSPRSDAFGDYELLEEIARGGMGVVYKARQVSLNRLVALKMILSGQLASAAEVQRFRAEAAAAANLQHPNIVAIYEVGEHEGQHYFSMEYIEGRDLGRLISDLRSPITDFKQSARWLQTMAEAIHSAHQRGILHRDLKPSNVLIDAHDQPRITDFGLAKRLSLSPHGNPELETRDPQLTLTGQVLGSPNFMPPEQATGRRGQIGPHSDVYSLGAILYHLLTARPPFLAETLSETLQQVQHTDPIPPRLTSPAVPRDLETICLKCLEKEPLQRYATAQELADELGRFLRDEPIQARPVSALEKTWRWCRRNPVVSSLAAGIVLLLIAVAIGSPIAAFRINQERRRAERANRDTQQANRELADSLGRMQIQRAEEFFTGDQSATALGYLARALRQNPSNNIAAERILSALSQRQFALPLSEPLQHPAHLYEAQFSPDGALFVTACDDGRGRLWDARTGRELGEPLQHEGPVLSAEFSPDGLQVVTASVDKTARIWEASTGHALTGPLQHEDVVLVARFSPDGRRVLTSSKDRTVRLWDARSGQLLATPFRHQIYSFSCACFSPDGQRVAAAFWKTVWVWDARSRQRLTNSFEHGGLIYTVAFSPDGQRLATASQDNTACIWDLRTGQRLAEMKLRSWVFAAEFSPDGKQVVTACRDGTARIWDGFDGSLLVDPLRHEGSVSSARFSADGQWVLTASDDKTARLWDARNGAPASEPIKHDSAVLSARLSADSQRVVTVCRDHTAWSWDVRASEALALPLQHANDVVEAQFSSDGQWVLTASRDKTARLWDTRTGQPRTAPLAQAAPLKTAHCSADGRWVVTAGLDGTARVWDARTGSPHGPPLRHDDYVWCARFSRDGQRVVTTSEDKTARIWETGSNPPPAIVLNHAAEVLFADFSPDGQQVVTACVDQSARLWDARTGRLQHVLRHQGVVFSAEFSGDGRRVITASGDHTARIWDARTGQPCTPPLQHDDQVHAASFSLDGRRAVTASKDKTAQLWDAFTGQALTEPLRHQQGVTAARFSPDSQRVVTASHDSTARLWDVRTGLPLSESLAHEDRVLSAEFSPDGQWIVTACVDGTARVWPTPSFAGPAPEWLPSLAEAMARQRFNARGVIEPVPLAALLTLKRQIGHDRASDPYLAWAKWFMDDRAARPISPLSPVTGPEFVHRRIEEGTAGSLQQAVRLSPTNVLALARLSRQLLALDIRKRPHLLRQADLLSRRALALASSDPEAWWTRAEFFRRAGKLPEAWEAIQHARARPPLEADFWHTLGRLLERSNRLDEAHQAFSKAVELVCANPDSSASARASHLLTRSDLLRYMNRPGEAQADFLQAKNIPARDLRASPKLIDLSAFYNAATADDWHSREGNGNDLASLPLGLGTFADVEFDVRGIVQLASLELRRGVYPERVEGIKIEQRCAAIHFLHSTGWHVVDGTTIGWFIMRYTDGQQAELPIVYGSDVRDWQFFRGMPEETEGPPFAWKGTQTRWKYEPGRAFGVRLYLSTWQNPRPETPVQSIDYVSAMTDAAPFLIAISAE